MSRIFTLSVFLIVFAIDLRAQEENIVVDSKIERVIVFLQGAQLERSGQTAVPTGNSTLVFKGLSPEIEDQSMQVKAEGNFTILSVNRQNNFLNEQRENGEIIRLEEEISNLRDKLDIQTNQILILKKEEDMLAQNQSVGNQGLGLDLNKLRLALDFQKARLTENKVKQLSIQKDISNLREQISKLMGQVNDLAGKSKRNTSDIVVKISAKAAGRALIHLSYLVKNATWFPTYDLRATDVNKPVDLVYRANVSQQSGEQWKNVKLVLSSGDPSRSGNRPELKLYQVGYNLANHQPGGYVNNVYGRIKDIDDGTYLPGVRIRVKGTSIGTTSDASGNYSIQIPSQNAILEYAYIGYEQTERPVVSAQIDVDLKVSHQLLSEVVVVGNGRQSKTISQALAGQAPGISISGINSVQESKPLEVQVEQGQTTVKFEIKQPYTIPSDGKQLAVEIAQHQLQAKFRYYAVPKLSNEVFLSATISGVDDLNLLSGEATMFFEGAYLGKTLINMQNASDTLEVSLGADKGVTVKRTKQKQQNAQSFIGSNQRATRGFLIEVFNHKSQPVAITVEDQLPVSNSSDVTVESQEITGANMDTATGKVAWDLLLQPGEKKELILKYQVKYPKNRPVVLE